MSPTADIVLRNVSVSFPVLSFRDVRCAAGSFVP